MKKLASDKHSRVFCRSISGKEKQSFVTFDSRSAGNASAPSASDLVSYMMSLGIDEVSTAFIYILASSASPVVEQLTNSPKFKGLNPTI